MEISLDCSALGGTNDIKSDVKVLRETYVLGLICIVDMMYTIMLVQSRTAIEANPILAPFMARGIGFFFVAKTMLDVIPLFCLELIRSKRPLLVKKMLRVCIAAYLLCYGIGVLKLNHAHASEYGHGRGHSVGAVESTNNAQHTYKYFG